MSASIGGLSVLDDDALHRMRQSRASRRNATNTGQPSSCCELNWTANNGLVIFRNCQLKKLNISHFLSGNSSHTVTATEIQ